MSLRVVVVFLKKYLQDSSGGALRVVVVVVFKNIYKMAAAEGVFFNNTTIHLKVSYPPP